MIMRKNTSVVLENCISVLQNAIQEGLDSGVAVNFDPKKHLEFLKANILCKGKNYGQ